ncbi:MAG TPA: DUF4403 family protein [Gammaproteobacteria bacterium]
MKLKNLVLTSSLLCAQGLQAQTATDKMLGMLIEKNIPQQLYSNQALAWDYGVYSLTIDKNGQSKFSSTENHIISEVPLAISMSGQLSNNPLMANMKVDCKGDFNTRARVKITPQFTAQKEAIKASIHLPIPEVFMDCNGFKLRIDPFLQQIVDNKKPEWEAQIETAFQQVLKKPQ